MWIPALWEQKYLATEFLFSDNVFYCTKKDEEEIIKY